MTHLDIKGKVTFSNSFGFLGAEQYPIMRFHMYMFLVFGIFTIIYLRQIHMHRSQVIMLHNLMVSILIMNCLVSLFIYLEYSYLNSHGKRNIRLLTLTILLRGASQTFARWTALVVSLGYGSFIGQLGQYSTKIGLLTFLYLISDLVSSYSFYMNQSIPISGYIRLAMTSP